MAYPMETLAVSFFGTRNPRLIRAQTYRYAAEMRSRSLISNLIRP